ncbi:MAG: hypothetical protein Ta2B_18980 [Termitinemataceae bacterium]|nr:MAG: hypothetical protein Ta2B_18980 [Termitinemataceae bacterium]
MFYFHSLPVLQGLKMFEIENTSPAHTATFVIGIAIIAAIIIFLNVSKFIKNSGIVQGNAPVGKAKKDKVTQGFYSAAKRYGLTRSESAWLERILKNAGDPEKVLQSNDKIDQEFKRELKAIERKLDDDDDIINEIATLFSIRNAIDYYNSASKKATPKGAIRSFKRRELNVMCNYTAVDTVKEKNGNEMKKRLVLTKEKAGGELLNISLGGCAIKPSRKLKVGRLLKVEFSMKRQAVGILGQVVRVNIDGRSSVMHIKFLKITKKAQNIVNTVIFDYE